MFKETIEKKNRKTLIFLLKITFAWMKIPISEHDIKKIFKANEKIKSQAIELIDSNLGGELKRRIIPLLEVKDTKLLLSVKEQTDISIETVKKSLKKIIHSSNYNEWFQGISLYLLREITPLDELYELNTETMPQFLKEVFVFH